MPVRPITDEEFRPEVVNGALPTLFVLGADWCGPCRQITPTLEAIAEKYEGQIVVASMDIDKNPLTPALVEIKGVPALYLFKDGYALGHKVGNMSEDFLVDWLTTEGCLA